MVEQDLIISRALVAIFSDAWLSEQMAFRGGTALHKLHFSPPARYSEDIDLVQIEPGPMRKTMDHLREALSFLGEPSTKRSTLGHRLIYRFETGIRPFMPMRLPHAAGRSRPFSCEEFVVYRGSLGSHIPVG